MFGICEEESNFIAERKTLTFQASQICHRQKCMRVFGKWREFGTSVCKINYLILATKLDYLQAYVVQQLSGAC